MFGCIWCTATLSEDGTCFRTDAKQNEIEQLVSCDLAVQVVLVSNTMCKAWPHNCDH